MADDRGLPAERPTMFGLVLSLTAAGLGHSKVLAPHRVVATRWLTGPFLYPCGEPSTPDYDSSVVPIPEHRRVPTDTDREVGLRMPVQTLDHRSPHRRTSSETDTPGCPAAAAERRRSTESNQIKSNLFLYNIQHSIHVYIITLLQFKMYMYNDCKCVVWTSHSHMAVFLRCPCATKQ